MCHRGAHVLLFILFISSVQGSSLTASTSGVIDYVQIPNSDLVIVPYYSDFSITKVIPGGNPNTRAQFVINLSFERGCEHQNFTDLECVYYSNNASVFCSDPYFGTGSAVYFVTGIKLWVDLTRGNRVDLSIDLDRLIIGDTICSTFNEQTQIVDTIVYDLLTKNYYHTAQFYSNDVVFSVNIEAFDYIGKATVISYFFLGDPDVSDSFETLNSSLVKIISDGNIVFAAYNQTIRSLQKPEGQNIYWDVQIHEVHFDEKNLIYKHKIYVDGLKVFFMYPSFSSPNATKTCETIMEYCFGTNQQFENMTDCLSFMNSLPLLKNGFAQSVAVNDVGCRSFHSSLLYAPGGPDIHCKHTGPFNAVISQGDSGYLVTPCVEGSQPPTPYVAPSTTQRALTSVGEYYYACDNLEVCKFKRIKKGQSAIFWPQVGFSQAHEALIPLAGELLQSLE